MHVVATRKAGEDFRCTFLRWHAARELRQTGDVLVLGKLRKRVTAVLGPKLGEAGLKRLGRLLDEKLSLEWFFYRGRPDYQLYMPLAVFPAKERVPRYPDLTDLLVKQRDEPDRAPPGIVLAARSGGGKTVASRKAFCDCFLGEKPRLANYLPCWLPIDPSIRRIKVVMEAVNRKKKPQKHEQVLEEQLKSVTSAVVEDLILRAATVEGRLERRFGSRDAQIDLWLRNGEPLLVFVDLNSFGAFERRIVAHSLVHYQREYRAQGHRCVVTYRSTEEDDKAMAPLKKSGIFELYDVEPVPRHLAMDYQANFRRTEADLFAWLKRELKLPKKLKLPTCSAQDVKQACKKLGELIDRYVRAGESLISTPLLMHFVSLLDKPRLKKVLTLAHLYRYVVEEHLERDWGTDAPLPRIAMTRVALAMQAWGQTTRISKEDFQGLLKAPEGGRHDRIGSNGPWWPDERDPDNAFWLDLEADREARSTKPPKQRRVPYYWQTLSDGQIERVREFSLFRRDGDQFGFLHDSFIYFFAGVGGLRDYQGPGLPSPGSGVPAKWSEKVTSRVREHPERWLLPMEFLGGALVVPPSGTSPLHARELDAMVGELLLGEADSRLVDLLIRLARGGAGPVAQSVCDVVLRQGPWLHRHPGALFQQVYNHLAGCEGCGGPCQSFATQSLLPRVLKGGRRWLRQVLGPPPSSAWTMDEHTAAVTRLAAHPDGRVVSGSDDRTVKLWDPETGQVETIIQHNGGVTCMAVLRDGSVVSGSKDHAIRLWNPETGQDKPIIEHADTINSVAILSDGSVASGSADHTVKRWDPESLQFHTIIQHDAAVLSVVGLATGGVLSAGEDWVVNLWNHNTGEVRRVLEEQQSSRWLAVLPDGKVVSGNAWVGHPNTILVWDPNTWKMLSIDEHLRANDTLAKAPQDHTIMVDSLAVALDGRVVFAVNESYYIPDSPCGGRDYKVIVWDPYRGDVEKLESCVWDPYSGEYRTMDAHESDVTCLAVRADGWVVSGGRDGAVKLWNPVTGEVQTIEKTSGEVTSVAVLPDGRILSGSVITSSGGPPRKGKVKLWGTAIGRDRIVNKHTGPVLSVAVLPDGRAVSGGSDGAVKLWDPAALEVQIVEQPFAGEGVQTLFDGRLVRWDRAFEHFKVVSFDGGQVEIHYRDRSAREVYAITALRDGRFVVVSGFGARLWDPATGEVKIMGESSRETAWADALSDARVVSSGSYWTVRLSSLTGPAETIIRPTHPITSVRALPDGSVVWGSLDLTVKRWAPGTRQVQTIIRHTAWVKSVGVLPDGSVVSGSGDLTVKRWDTRTGEVQTIIQHADAVESVGVLPDGSVVSGSHDETVRLWDPDGGQVLTFPTNAPVSCIAGSNSLSRIAAGLKDGEVVILDVEPEASLRCPPPAP